MTRPPLPPFDAASRAPRCRPPRTPGTATTPNASSPLTPRIRSGATATVLHRPRRDRRVPQGEVGPRAGVRAAQGHVGVRGQPHRRAVPVREPRRRRAVVALLRQRAVGVRRRRATCAVARRASTTCGSTRPIAGSTVRGRRRSAADPRSRCSRRGTTAARRHARARHVAPLSPLAAGLRSAARPRRRRRRCGRRSS